MRVHLRTFHLERLHMTSTLAHPFADVLDLRAISPRERHATIFTRFDANIIEVAHQRVFGVPSAKSTTTEIEYEIKDPAAAMALEQALSDAGYAFDRLTISGTRKGPRGSRG